MPLLLYLALVLRLRGVSASKQRDLLIFPVRDMKSVKRHAAPRLSKFSRPRDFAKGQFLAQGAAITKKNASRLSSAWRRSTMARPTRQRSHNRNTALAPSRSQSRLHGLMSLGQGADEKNIIEDAIAAVSLDASQLEHVNNELKDNFKVALAAVVQSPEALQWASQRLRNNRELVFAAVSQEGTALQWASQRLRGYDKDLALAAVKDDSMALLHVQLPMQADRDVVLAAVRTEMSSAMLIEESNAFQHTAPELQADPEIMRAASSARDALQLMAQNHILAALQRCGAVLEHLSTLDRNKKELVEAAVRQNGLALNWASKDRKNDRDIVLIAVQQAGQALEYASEKLRSDPEVVMAAVISCLPKKNVHVRSGCLKPVHCSQHNFTIGITHFRTNMWHFDELKMR